MKKSTRVFITVGCGVAITIAVVIVVSVVYIAPDIS